MVPSNIAANDWQRPAKTELWAFEEFNNDPSSSEFLDYTGFPWATLIDLKRRGEKSRALTLERKLRAFGPKKTLIRATVCQHIWVRDVFPYLKDLQITDLFWSHKTVSQDEIDGIRLHPFPLYPVVFGDRLSEQTRDQALLGGRRWLYNFVGAYDPDVYLTPARSWLFELPPLANAIIQRRPGWHYERDVYESQIKQTAGARSDEYLKDPATEKYKETIAQSVFTICPSGSGPNTIRFWEALGAGSIPVLISDKLALPESGLDWSEAIVRTPESKAAIQALPERLLDLAKNADALNRMRSAGAMKWREMVVNGPARLINKLGSPDWLTKTMFMNASP